MSPFDELPLSQDSVPSEKGHHLLAVMVVILGLVVVVLGMLVWRQTVNDPFRTLEAFPVDKYFDTPRALTGNRFKATLKVEGDLGWSAHTGKLLVFSVDGDSRLIPVLVPEDSLRHPFSKGQIYIAQIQIEDGGLIRANDFRKK